MASHQGLKGSCLYCLICRSFVYTIFVLPLYLLEVIHICNKARQQAKACKFLKVLRHSAESYWGKDVSPPLKIGDSSNLFLDRPNRREPTPDQCFCVRVLKGRRPTQERLPLPPKVRFSAEKETPC